jgi:hypothetical protein
MKPFFKYVDKFANLKSLNIVPFPSYIVNLCFNTVEIVTLVSYLMGFTMVMLLACNH